MNGPAFRFMLRLVYAEKDMTRAFTIEEDRSGVRVMIWVHTFHNINRAKPASDYRGREH